MLFPDWKINKLDVIKIRDLWIIKAMFWFNECDVWMSISNYDICLCCKNKITSIFRANSCCSCWCVLMGCVSCSVVVVVVGKATSIGFERPICVPSFFAICSSRIFSFDLSASAEIGLSKAAMDSAFSPVTSRCLNCFFENN